MSSKALKKHVAAPAETTQQDVIDAAEEDEEEEDGEITTPQEPLSNFTMSSGKGIFILPETAMIRWHESGLVSHLPEEVGADGKPKRQQVVVRPKDVVVIEGVKDGQLARIWCYRLTTAPDALKRMNQTQVKKVRQQLDTDQALAKSSLRHADMEETTRENIDPSLQGWPHRPKPRVKRAPTQRKRAAPLLERNDGVCPTTPAETVRVQHPGVKKQKPTTQSTLTDHIGKPPNAGTSKAPPPVVDSEDSGDLFEESDEESNGEDPVDMVKTEDKAPNDSDDEDSLSDSGSNAAGTSASVAEVSTVFPESGAVQAQRPKPLKLTDTQGKVQKNTDPAASTKTGKTPKPTPVGGSQLSRGPNWLQSLALGTSVKEKVDFTIGNAVRITIEDNELNLYNINTPH